VISIQGVIAAQHIIHCIVILVKWGHPEIIILHTALVCMQNDRHIIMRIAFYDEHKEARNEIVYTSTAL
jgi:hypothetical protein